MTNRIYLKVISIVDKFVPQSIRPLWEHPAGPKTIFFWAPLVKWTIVGAGVSDVMRPAEVISIRQVGALAIAGFIWTRWSLVISPKNYSLCAVNLCQGIIGSIMTFRAARYQWHHRNEPEKKV